MPSEANQPLLASAARGARSAASSLSQTIQSAFSSAASAVQSYFSHQPPRSAIRAAQGLTVVVFLAAVAFFTISLASSDPDPATLETRSRGHNACHSKGYRGSTLKLVREDTVFALVPGSGVRKFEASDVTPVHHRHAKVVVFDNIFDIGLFFSDPDTPNALVPWPAAPADRDSGFEAVAYNASSGTYLVVQESSVIPNGTFTPLVHDVALDVDNRTIHDVSQCRVNFRVPSGNKGFEGAAVVSVPGGGSLLLGLCEGNYCSSGHTGRESGNGRVVVLRREEDGRGACTYERVGIVEVPEEADFEDYSGLSVTPEGRVAITSQASAAVWVGKITVTPAGKVELSDGEVYEFPRNDNCDVVYCNVEGVYFEDEVTLVVVSDRMKSRGRQPFYCLGKDQSVHTFSIP